MPYPRFGPDEETCEKVRKDNAKVRKRVSEEYNQYLWCASFRAGLLEDLGDCQSENYTFKP